MNNVDLSLNRGEILGLVGDNAAGKSTLMKILSGVYLPDNGEVFFKGKRVAFHSPSDSREIGIEMIYQDLAVADNKILRLYLSVTVCLTYLKWETE